MRHPAHHCQDVGNCAANTCRCRRSARHAATEPLLRGVAAVAIRRAHDRRRAPRRVVLDAHRPRCVQPRTARHGNRDPAARSTAATADGHVRRSRMRCRCRSRSHSRMRAPLAAVLAVDVNARARTLCSDNADRLGLTNVTVAHPDEVPADLAVDLIWSNPPIRIGKPALHAILTTWLGRLDTGRVGGAGRATPSRRRLARSVAAIERAPDPPSRGPRGLSRARVPTRLVRQATVQPSNTVRNHSATER